LNRFVAKLVEQSFSFFILLRGSAKIEWGAEQQKVFDDLKSYLQQLPTLSSLEQGQPLILYVSTTHAAISRALVLEKEVTKNSKTAKQQFPVYFAPEVLTRSKRYYSEIEKFCYALIMRTRKLCHYFEAHTIKVFTNQPLNDISGNRNSSG
jgi:hypothetical protein